MREFIKRLFFYACILTMYFAINVLINKSIIKKHALGLDQKNILIVGDSHPQRSLNPKLFHSAQNISQSAEPCVLTYWKLDKIFESYIPDTLIIGISPHTISAFNDFKFSDKTWSEEMFKRSYLIHKFSSISKDIEVDFETYYRVLWRQMALLPELSPIKFIGYYNSSNSSNVKNWEKPIKRHYYRSEQELGISQVSLNSLESIAKLCESKNVEFVIVGQPLHRDYLRNIPSVNMEAYKNLFEDYSKDYIVIDKTFEAYPDEYFLNVDHLNDKGARIFTQEIISVLKTYNQ